MKNSFVISLRDTARSTSLIIARGFNYKYDTNVDFHYQKEKHSDILTVSHLKKMKTSEFKDRNVISCK